MAARPARMRRALPPLDAGERRAGRGPCVGAVVWSSRRGSISRLRKLEAAMETLSLLEKHKVEVIIGPQKSSQAVFVSELGSRTHVPVVSFSATSPSLSHRSLPYFVRATVNDSAQASCIASLMKTYGWREVVPIYEDTDYGRGIMPYLIDALQGIDARVPYRSLISPTATGEQITEELRKLMTMQTRVFVVHMDLKLASFLFTKANEVGMMNKGYAWIMTDGLSNLIGSMSPVFEAMDGALGVQFYLPESAELDKFTVRWNRRFQMDNPNGPLFQVNVFALWGYDVIWAVARAAELIGVAKSASVQKPKTKNGSTSLESLATSANGPKLLEAILQSKLRGLSGNFDLSDGHLQASTFRIINVAGKQWKEIGICTARNGVSLQLNAVTWPGKSTEIPRGWEVPVTGKKLQVGVRNSGYPEFMTVTKDPFTGAIKATGFSIDVFEEAVKRLPYALPYEYVVFDTLRDTSIRSYDEFVYQVYLKNYDAAIGDITIRYNRSFYVDFTLPYTESGVAMVVPVKASDNKNTWIFAKPLSKGLWFGSIALFIGTGFVVWVLEFIGGNEEIGGSFREKLLQPTVTDVHELIKSKEYVGYRRGSYIKGLLEEIGFDSSRIKPYSTPDDFHNALSSGSKNGGIAALVHEVPYIKLFLAEYCKEYTMVGPIYKTAGFGFAFPKGSPLLGDISKAILNITGGDAIIQIEKKWTADRNNCPNMGPVDEPGSLTFEEFRGLFILTGAVSVCSLYIGLSIFLFKRRYGLNNHNAGHQQIGDVHGGQGQDENDQDQVEGTQQDGLDGIRQEDGHGGRGPEISDQHGEAHRDIDNGDEIRETRPNNIAAQPRWVVTWGTGSLSAEAADNHSILKHRGSAGSSSNHRRANTMIY
ncbi:hypothetical protein EJB05_35244, partial [Eragrostis curvula]